MPPRIQIDVEPVAVRARDACRMLGCGLTHLYRLMAAGEIEGFRDGAARKISVASIRRYIEQRLSEEAARRPGRPSRKPEIAV
jgi:excisionase family DNA binding protein